ncbi:NAD(P)H-hydrate epimerase [Levilactobacillus bambusae]|uniref:NAD(P)H-hydrate epimerase n=1 Tax=Levilactobacillus bambusae TaxID=2024736 RepID=A0A2V1N073_9LACO|nr:NAD(P)H-hydrate epimerase [Levilactobacillus bambusae]PWF99824.1 NAD(P)H-hydrate epimerase [Levilactobacillus bambusae]
MTDAITVAQAQEYDHYTMEEVGIPSLVLMERAALACYRDILTGPFDLSRILVVAGSGNNGGDGVAVARLLRIHGLNVRLMLVGQPDHATEQTKQQLKIAAHYQTPMTTETADIEHATLVVDGIFGVGLSRPVEGHYATIIHQINEVDAPVFAIDVPSGINADTGDVLGVALTARMTTTMGYRKIGFETTSGRQHVGQLHVADIGVYAPSPLIPSK